LRRELLTGIMYAKKVLYYGDNLEILRHIQGRKPFNKSRGNPAMNYVNKDTTHAINRGRKKKTPQ